MSIEKTKENCFTCAQPLYGDEACLKYHDKCLPIEKMGKEYIQNVTPFPPLNIVVRAAAIARLLQIKRLIERACRIKNAAIKKEGIKTYTKLKKENKDESKNSQTCRNDYKD